MLQGIEDLRIQIKIMEKHNLNECLSEEQTSESRTHRVRYSACFTHEKVLFGTQLIDCDEGARANHLPSPTFTSKGIQNQPTPKIKHNPMRNPRHSRAFSLIF